MPRSRQLVRGAQDPKTSPERVMAVKDIISGTIALIDRDGPILSPWALFTLQVEFRRAKRMLDELALTVT